MVCNDLLLWVFTPCRVPTLCQSWSVWTIDYRRSDSMRVLRLGYEGLQFLTRGSFYLRMSWGKRCLECPYVEVCMVRNGNLLPTTMWGKQILQPLQTTAAQASSLTATSRETLSQGSTSWIPDPQKLCKNNKCLLLYAAKFGGNLLLHLSFKPQVQSFWFPKVFPDNT